MTPTPEPAVGQVWAFPPDDVDLPNYVFHIIGIHVKHFEPPDEYHAVGNLGDGLTTCYTKERAYYLTMPLGPRGGIKESFTKDAINGTTYLGTLDELREHQALRAELEAYRTQVRTDNSAVVANLEVKVHLLEQAIRRIVVTDATWRNTDDHAGAMASALRKAEALLGATADEAYSAQANLEAENAKLRAALKELLYAEHESRGWGDSLPQNVADRIAAARGTAAALTH